MKLGQSGAVAGFPAVRFLADCGDVLHGGLPIDSSLFVLCVQLDFSVRCGREFPFTSVVDDGAKYVSNLDR